MVAEHDEPARVSRTATYSCDPTWRVSTQLTLAHSQAIAQVSLTSEKASLSSRRNG